MKSLQTIQKTFRVFRTLTRIGMILSFIWAGLTVLGLVCGLVWQSGGTVFGADRELAYTMTETGSLNEMIGVLISDTILALTDGVLLAFALRYFSAEQADGTPFTQRGAQQMLRLGVRTIVLPLVATILVAVVHEIFGVTAAAGSDWGNLDSVAMGIVLILASLIFRYGADLEERNAPMNAAESRE